LSAFEAKRTWQERGRLVDRSSLTPKPTLQVIV
jgi:hypothetical protein